MSDVKYIAIIDDHTMFRKGLASLINLFNGYKVILDAANGNELISKLDKSRLPHIALVDISMPVMDGYDTAQWLTQNYPGVKILALSTLDAETAIIKMIKCGAKGYVLKDADPLELKQAFDQLDTAGFYYNEMVTHKVLKSVNLLINEKSDVSLFAKLTPRELEFIRLACSEKTYFQIAAEMFLSERTIDGYRDTLFRKLNITSRVGLVLYAVKNKLINL
jgi:DNA-binding NarL/FixJ family response regulator